MEVISEKKEEIGNSLHELTSEVISEVVEQVCPTLSLLESKFEIFDLKFMHSLLSSEQEERAEESLKGL